MGGREGRHGNVSIEGLASTGCWILCCRAAGGEAEVGRAYMDRTRGVGDQGLAAQ